MEKQFEWDEEKNKANREKHKIDFETAIRVFLDPNRIDFLDEEHSLTEERRITIDIVNSVVFVVYTEKNDSIRIISARKANQKEVKLYGDSLL